MTKEDRGALARKYLERESEYAQPASQSTTPIQSTKQAPERREADVRFPVAVLWTAAVIVGIATGSVPLGVAVIAGGGLLLGIFMRVSRIGS